MPSRKLTSHCSQCGSKNHLRSLYCNQCGSRLKEDRTVRDQDGRAKLYADIAHPINSQCREKIQKHVIEEFRAELGRATQPDYVSRYDDDYDDSFDVTEVELAPAQEEPSPRRVLAAHSHAEPAEVEPRPPHRRPAAVPAKQTAPRETDQFGAGIFE
jgi:stage V sporulation protein G